MPNDLSTKVNLPNGEETTLGDLMVMHATRNAMISMNTPALPRMEEYEVMKAMANSVAYSGFLTSNAPPSNIIQRTADALFVMMMGRELGIPPITSIKTIYVIDGKPSTSGQAMLSLLRRGGCTVIIPDPGAVKDSATVKIKRPGATEFSEYTYTLEMAEKAGLLTKKNWKNHPAEMLVWRAVSTGAKFEGSDVIGGLYLVEEINPNIEVSSEGDVIQGALTPPAPKTSGKITSSNDDDTEPPQPAESTMDTTAWAMAENLAELLSRLAKAPYNIAKTDIPVLIPDITDVDDADLWNKLFASGKEAAAAIVKADEARIAAMKPATPKKKSEAELHIWTDADIKALDDACAGWFDTEAFGVLIPEMVLGALGKIAWSEFKTVEEAQKALKKYALDAKLAIVTDKVVWRGKMKPMTLSNGQIDVTLRGRDVFRDLGWTEVESWNEVKQYTLPGKLVVECEYKTPEKGEPYFSTDKDSISLLQDIEF